MTRKTLDLQIKTEADIRAWKALNKQARGLDSVVGRIGRGFTQGLGIGGGIGLFQRLADSISQAATAGHRFNSMMEQQQVRFETLLGSRGAASQRVKELIRFSATTPFQIDDVTQLSALLQTLTNGALATDEGLRLVGDAASAAGRGLQETGMWVGRLYAGLQSGTPIGEATLRLLEMGLISGEQKVELDEMAKSAHDVNEVQTILQNTFGKTAGAMEKQSATMKGLTSTFKDLLAIEAGAASSSLFASTKNFLEFGIGILQSVQTLRNLEGMNTPQAAAAEVGINRAQFLSEQNDLVKANEQIITTLTNLEEEFRQTSARIQHETGKEREQSEKRLAAIQKQLETAKLVRDEIKKRMDLEQSGTVQQEKSLRAQREAVRLGEAEFQQRLANLRHELELTEFAGKDLKNLEERKRINFDINDLLQQRIDELLRLAALEEAAGNSETASRLLGQVDSLSNQREIGQRRGALENRTRFETVQDSFDNRGDPRESFQTMGEAGRAALMQFAMEAGTVQDNFFDALMNIQGSLQGGIQDSLDGLIDGTMTWDQALTNIGKTLGTTVVKSITQMFAAWIAGKIAMFAIEKLGAVQSAATGSAVAAGLTGAWSVPATLATIASFGGAAAQAPLSIATSLGMTQGITAGFSAGTSGLGAFAGVADTGGTVRPGEFAIKGGIPEIISNQGGVVDITPLPMATGGGNFSLSSNDFEGVGEKLNVIMVNDENELRDAIERLQGRVQIVERTASRVA